MRFGETELSRFQPNMGGYVGADAGSNEIFLNPRSGPVPFRRVSLQQVMDGEVDPAWIEDAVVLIGITSMSVKDLVNSAAVASENPGLIYGVEIQAHAASQIIHAALDGRPLLHTWPDLGEYLWIILWGGVSIILFLLFPKPAKYSPIIFLVGLGVGGTSFGLLWLWGLWLPVIPTVGAIWISGFVYDLKLRAQVTQLKKLAKERQRVIEQTYNAIHNGPLQTLALLLRDAGEELNWSTALEKLRSMDRELRNIYETLLDASPDADHQFLALAPFAQDDSSPLHEKLCAVYKTTLERDFPGFQTIQLNLVTFEPLSTPGLTVDDQQDLCRFLEEAICNVGKHAVNPTRLTVKCCTTEHENLIQVEDNGNRMTNTPNPAPSGRRGTRQAEQLARRLQGKFSRSTTEKGTRCELRWPLNTLSPVSKTGL
jgi:hypothetical protein